MQFSKVKGFTLIEMMIVIGILGIILSIAVPLFSNMINAVKLKSSIESVKNDLVFAKNEALKQNKNTFIKISKTSATDWCIGVSTTDTCDCKTAAASCDLYTRIEPGVSLISDGIQVEFDKTRTLPNSLVFLKPLPLNITLARGNSTDEKHAAVSLNPVGKTIICSPTSGKSLGGLPAC